MTSYSDEVLADGPTSYWRMGESSGTAMLDAKGLNNGTYIGAPTLGQPGALPYDSNTAATFNGTTARSEVPDSNSGSAPCSPTARSSTATRTVR